MSRLVYIVESMKEDLFWAKVNKTETCWFWTGAKTDGYGALNHGRKNYKAHRVAWELHKGPLPENMQIDHMCMIRSCVNPGHLRLVAQSENLLSRSVEKHKSRPGKSKKSYLLYIHNPKFREEVQKSKLVNSLLDEYYSDKRYDFCKHDAVKGFCKKGCR